MYGAHSPPSGDSRASLFPGEKTWNPTSIVCGGFLQKKKTSQDFPSKIFLCLCFFVNYPFFFWFFFSLCKLLRSLNHSCIRLCVCSSLTCLLLPPDREEWKLEWWLPYITLRVITDPKQRCLSVLHSFLFPLHRPHLFTSHPPCPRLSLPPSLVSGSPGCLILPTVKSVWVTLHLTRPSPLSSLLLSPPLFQRVPGRPHRGRADRWAPPIYPWHVFSTARPAGEGEHGQSGPHGRPALTIHRQHP